MILCSFCDLGTRAKVLTVGLFTSQRYSLNVKGANGTDDQGFVLTVGVSDTHGHRMSYIPTSRWRHSTH